MSANEPALIYNLFPRLAGTMSNWNEYFQRARGMKFNWIFLNPINQAGFSGSLYAVKDYFKINPLFCDNEENGVEELKDMLKKADELGLSVMYDLVINHTAKDAWLVDKHPDWYKRDESGNIQSPWAMDGERKIVWGDLAELDHENNDKKEEMLAFFERVIEFYIDVGFKGFRCDAAYKLPGSVWERLISKARSINPDIKFFAETLGCSVDETIETAGSGFDYIFNSSKWWDFEESWCLEQLDKSRKIVPSISFPESHDTRRLMKELNGDVSRVKQRHAFESMFSKGVMITLGFEYGWQRRVDVCETSPKHREPVHADLTDFITRCNQMKLENPVFAEDSKITPVEADEDALAVFKKESSTGQKGLIIINKSFKHGYTYSADSLKNLLGTDDKIEDVSPTYNIPELEDRFEYGLRPGQVIALASKPE